MNNAQREKGIHHLYLAQLELERAWSSLVASPDYQLTDPRPRISKMILDLVAIRLQVQKLQSTEEFREQFDKLWNKGKTNEA